MKTRKLSRQQERDLRRWVRQESQAGRYGALRPEIVDHVADSMGLHRQSVRGLVNRTLRHEMAKERRRLLA